MKRLPGTNRSLRRAAREFALRVLNALCRFGVSLIRLLAKGRLHAPALLLTWAVVGLDALAWRVAWSLIREDAEILAKEASR